MNTGPSSTQLPAEPCFILSLDGGGAKGFYSLGVLKEIEAMIGGPLCQRFDLIFGTSTGAIIAALLALGHSVDEIHDLYRTHVPVIMKKRTARGRSRALAHLALTVFGDRTFADVKTSIGIVATRWEFERPMIFKANPGQAHGRQATFAPGFGCTVAAAVQASCSAYPFFRKAVVTTGDGKRVALIDGGYCANNPTLYAIADAVQMLGHQQSNLRVVSVGVGAYPEPRRWSSWVKARFLPIQLLQKTLNVNTASMEQLRGILFKDAPTVRVNDTFERPEMATDLLESDPATVVEWMLVAAFAAECGIQGAVAEDRRAWLRSPWRIVDAVTVLGPVVALLPQVSDITRGSLMLRMLRVGRAVAFGTRAGSVVVRRERGTGHTMRATTPTVSVISADGDLHPVKSDWATFLAWTRAPGASWFHASNLDRRRFSEIARAAGVSDRDVEQALSEDGHAKLRQEASYATLVLQVPTVASSGFPEVYRDRILAVITDRGLLTATTGQLNLQDGIVSQQAALPIASFPVRIVCALLSMARERNLAVAQRFDDEARRLETLDGGHVFLRETFRLRREISTAALDLWHVKGIIRSLADGKTRLRGVDLSEEKYLDDLLAEAESLWETVNENKEELKTLIELHINFKSFEMNKFLKLLAVVSFLGLIPSVAGGLLGMNVDGNPWPVTLGQVSFGVAMGMATALYVFAVKGWLK